LPAAADASQAADTKKSWEKYMSMSGKARKTASSAHHVQNSRTKTPKAVFGRRKRTLCTVSFEKIANANIY
jgi:hypothetical protein